ncbi:MAG: DUF368 domain-containing protein [Candidatus Thermoplasmatota archaeon]|nr:DUF368 domain-containing protein [Candidatus Thermoplasmatota archaeon]
MGSADIIPGISGGTIALITGIYERLIQSIKSIDLKIIPNLVRGFVSKNYLKKAKKNFLNIDFPFLLPLLAGICVAFLALAPVLKLLFDNYPSYTSAFFFGLIISSACVMFIRIRFEVTWKSTWFIFFGLIAGLLIVGLQGVQTENSHLIIFFSGIISFCAMILPGISGAFILYLLGQYEFMLGVLQEIEHLDFSKLSFAIVYVVGGLIGLLVFSRLLSYLFNKYRGPTITFIIGLMVGALRIPAEKMNLAAENLMFNILFGILGAFIVFFVSYHGNLTKHTTK